MGIEYVLSQRQLSDHTRKLIERPISYGSTHLRGSQMKMGSTGLELTGVCFFNKEIRLLVTWCEILVNY